MRKHAASEGAQPPESPKRRAWWIVTLIIVLVVLIGGAFYYYLSQPVAKHHPMDAVIPGNNTAPSTAAADMTSRTNVLLIGTDTRPGETGGNTDVLLLASLDAKNKRIELLSIPRDTKVKFPDGSEAKINESLQIGGPDLTVALVQQLTGQPIDDYALTHFGGLVQIIDTVGGVTVDVPEPMHYNTGDTEYNIINLNPGVQKLSGTQALGFVRFRHDALGDIGRTERQQQFVKALTKALLQPSNIVKLPTLIHEFWGTIDTDMSLLDVLKIASHAEAYRGYEMINETLPGSFHNPDPGIPNDESYWIVNPLEAQYMAKHFFEDGLVQKNPVQDPSVTENWTPPTSSPGNTTASQNATGPQNQTAGTTAAGTGTAAQNTTGPVTQTTFGNVETYSVSASSAYIRSGPGSNYPVVGSVLHGETVSVISHSGEWDEVILGDGQTGYVAGWLLSSEKK